MPNVLRIYVRILTPISFSSIFLCDVKLIKFGVFAVLEKDYCFNHI